MRNVSLLVCVLAGLLCFLAPPAHSADLQQYLAARLEPPEPGSTSNNLELVLENRSSKYIVAYAVEFTVSITGSSPRASGLVIEDFVPSLASVGRSAPIEDKHVHIGPIHPGEIIYRVGPENQPNTFISVAVKMVIFGDNTAIGDANKIASVFSDHKAAAEELERFLPQYASTQADLRQHFQRLKDELTLSMQQRPSTREERDRRSIRITLLSHITGALNNKDQAALERWREFQKSYLADQARAYREHFELKGGE